MFCNQRGVEALANSPPEAWSLKSKLRRIASRTCCCAGKGVVQKQSGRVFPTQRSGYGEVARSILKAAISRTPAAKGDPTHESHFLCRVM